MIGCSPIALKKPDYYEIVYRNEKCTTNYVAPTIDGSLGLGSIGYGFYSCQKGSITPCATGAIFGALMLWSSSYGVKTTAKCNEFMKLR